MSDEFKEIVDFVEKELLLIEDLLELVLDGSSLHLILDSKKEVYTKLLDLILNKKNARRKLMLVNN